MTLAEKRIAVHNAALAFEAARDAATRDALFIAVQVSKRSEFATGPESPQGFEIIQTDGVRERVVGYANTQELAEQIVQKLNTP